MPGVSDYLKAALPNSFKALYTDIFVCFTECTMPGIISHCEKYGRFGFVFAKESLYNEGARPCLYVDDKHYELVKTLKTNDPSNKEITRLYHLTNFYKIKSPKPQDFTHEREWRHFGNLDFNTIPIQALICPSTYTDQVKAQFPSTNNIIPIDMLFQMGV